LGIPKPSSRYSALKDVKPHIVGATFVLAHSLTSSDELETTKEGQIVYTTNGSFIMSYILTPTDVNDTIYFGISKSANITEVHDEIDKILQRLGIKPQGRKKCTNLWSYYPRAFDLYENFNDGRSHKKIIQSIQESLIPKGWRCCI